MGIEIIAGLALSAIGGVMQYKQGQAAQDAQKKAQQAQSRATQLQAQRERIQAAREARIKRAQIVAATGTMGVGQESSGPAGATSSIASQLGSNIGFMSQQEQFADQASRANQQAASAMSSAATWQALGGVGQSIFQAKGGFTTIFGGNSFESATPQKRKMTPF